MADSVIQTMLQRFEARLKQLLEEEQSLYNSIKGYQALVEDTYKKIAVQAEEYAALRWVIQKLEERLESMFAGTKPKV